MKILVINCGSSSLKYQLMDMDNERVLAKGLAERIGIEGSVLTHKSEEMESVVIKRDMKNHKVALEILMNALTDEKHGVIKTMDEISAVGHRVVHAGEKFASSVLITEDVMNALKECIDIAPLHNPPNIMGIEACKEILPDVPMVGVFDTAFHQTMPKEAYIYPIPYEYYEKYKIRKYGFHGTSHKYVGLRAASILNKPINDLKIITCHLGNGASITAIKEGISIDTSMGFTPLEGLAMGTRCGSIDPAILTFLMEKEELNSQEINNILNKKSGVLGVSGVSNDFRDIEEAAQKGNKRAQLALDIFNYRVRTTIGSYVAAMNGVDAIVFTAGLGENSATNRKDICDKLQFLGLSIDDDKNNIRGKETIISTEDSKVKVLVIPTDEELMIAKDTEEIVANII
ncbi:MAG TPA: acetate kinase [Eubacteriaceae bacterium]|nr:acetate kinase [Eubacteriaceae bacterium]